jgi:DNA polymerase-3 subunit delta'
MPFRDITGHRQLIDLLVRAVARESLPPSLIFGGPKGVGKALTAVALAQLLNCEQPVAGFGAGSEARDACGKCPACRRIQRAADAYREGRDRPAVDCLQWLEPDEKASIKIDPVRDVLARAAYRPFDGRTRVVLIDDAHALEVAAQQALLKMLEEPPPRTRFVLVTPQPDALLPTIRSRCPLMRFGPLSGADIAEALVTRHGWRPADAEAAASVSDGGFGRALGGDEPVRQHARELAASVLGAVAASRGPLERLDAAQALAARSETARGKTEGSRGRGSVASRPEMSARLDAIAALLRDIGVLTTRADQRRLANRDLAGLLEQMAPAFPGDRLVRAFTAVDEARIALERNASQKVVADWLALNL